MKQREEDSVVQTDNSGNGTLKSELPTGGGEGGGGSSNKHGNAVWQETGMRADLLALW